MDRRPIRIAPEPLDDAQISFQAATGAFQPDLAALIVDESPFHGCSLVVREDPRLVVGAVCTVKVGRMDPVPARLAWNRPLDVKLVRVGFAYLA